MSETEVHRRTSYTYMGPFLILCVSLEFQDRLRQSVSLEV